MRAARREAARALLWERWLALVLCARRSLYKAGLVYKCTVIKKNVNRNVFHDRVPFLWMQVGRDVGRDTYIDRKLCLFNGLSLCIIYSSEVRSFDCEKWFINNRILQQLCKNRTTN